MNVLIVLAKAPVPGQVKTRLCPPATPTQAADIAAAALLDTLDATQAVPDTTTVVALHGTPTGAAAHRLRSTHLLPQRGTTLAERIAAAHADVADRLPAATTLQIGMDTPQIDPTLLAECLERLSTVDAALGPADDGGWWALGLRDPRGAAVVRTVPTSRPDTGALTHRALVDAGLRVAILPTLVDVDTMADATAVAAQLPGSRFAAAVAAIGAPR